MTSPSARSRAFVVGVLCAAGGAGAGAVATATASTTHSTPQATAHHQRAGHAGRHGRHGLTRRAVSGSLVVHTKSGYQPVTFERGVVDSVNGDQLTISEGSAEHVYKQVTVTVPSSAKVRDNRAQSSLSSVAAGERVFVLQGPKRTLVRAHTPRQRTSDSQHAGA